MVLLIVFLFLLIIGKVFYKTDVRKFGSGNLGGTNTGRVLGKGAGLGEDGNRSLHLRFLDYIEYERKDKDTRTDANEGVRTVEYRKVYKTEINEIDNVTERESVDHISYSARNYHGERNRAKRVITAAFRSAYPQIAAGNDFVIVARTRILNVKCKFKKRTNHYSYTYYIFIISFNIYGYHLSTP